MCKLIISLGIFLFKDFLPPDIKSSFRGVQERKPEAPRASRGSEVLVYRMIWSNAQACKISEILDVAPLFHSLLGAE